MCTTWQPGHWPVGVISVMQPSSQAPPASGLTLAYLADCVAPQDHVRLCLLTAVRESPEQAQCMICSPFVDLRRDPVWEYWT